MKLYNICDYVTERIDSQSLTTSNYISTENMLPNKEGITHANNIPKGNVVAYNKGDILISNIRPYFKKIWQANINGGCSSDVLCIRAKSIVYSKFLFYLLSQQSFFDYVMSGAKGCKMPRGDKQQIMQWDIELPRLNEQTIIANTLSSLDDKIELNRRINENLEQQAQALFKSWFVDFEPFKDGKFVDSELGMIPEGWKVGTIGNYSNVRSGFAFKSSWWTDKGVKIVKIKNISSSGNLDMNDCSYVSKENTLKAKEFSLKPGDLLIAMTGATIGKFCIVPILKEEMYVNQRVGKFFLGEEPILKVPFIYGLLKSENIISQIINKGQGSAQANISANDIETISIILPPKDIISKYNELVSPYFSLLIKNLNECDYLAQLRDILLPKLMSGELQIPYFRNTII